MVIFVYGEDGYRVERKFRQLLEQFRKKFEGASFNIDSFDAAAADVSKVREIINSPPFMAPKRLVAVRGFSAWEKDDEFRALLPAVPETTIAIFRDILSEKDFASLKLPEQEKDWFVYPCPKFAGVELVKFAREEAQRVGAQLSPSLLNALIERLGEDSWRIVSELEKLAAYANGAPVTREMIGLQVEEKTEDDIFALVEALTAGDKKQAFQLVADQLSLDANPLYLLTMMERQARLLLTAASALEGGVQASELASAIGVHPFVARKLSMSAPRAKKRAEKLLTQIVEADRGIKTGTVEGETALYLIVASLS